MNAMFFKILREGDGQVWHLLSAKRPGRWTKVADPLVYNRNDHGLTNPLRRWQTRAKLYPVEVELGSSSGSRLVRRVLNNRVFILDDWPMARTVRCRLWPEITRKWPYLQFRPDIQCFLAATDRSHDPDCDISWVDLFRADLSWADLGNADLHGANLAEAKLIQTTLVGANLEGVDMTGAYLTWASMDGARLNGATLTDANLDGASLHDADLTGANLVPANLTGAYLRGARLNGATLIGANLQGAYLDDIELIGVDLSHAGLDRAYRPDDPPTGWKPDQGGRLFRA